MFVEHPIECAGSDTEMFSDFFKGEIGRKYIKVFQLIVKRVVNTFYDCGFSDDFLRKHFHKGQLKTMIDQYSPEWVIAATKRATEADKLNIGYITAILKKWQEKATHCSEA